MGKISSTWNLFQGATSFNQDISNWDTARVTDMARMFQGASSFDQPIGSWNVAKVDDMNSIFRDTVSFKQDISAWSTSSAYSQAVESLPSCDPCTTATTTSMIITSTPQCALPQDEPIGEDEDPTSQDQADALSDNIANAAYLTN